MDHVMGCITPSCHHAVHKAGHWVWSTGDGHRLTIDNIWRWSTCRREIILSSAVREKLQTPTHHKTAVFKFKASLCLL